MNTRTLHLFPRALEVAAKTLADRPKMLGEIVVALVGEDGGAAPGKARAALNDVQRYVVEACRAEMDELRDRRMAAAERKARQRARGMG